MRTTILRAVALACATALVATPAAAKLGQLTVTGKITTGDDSGTDFLGASVVNNVYVESFAPGSCFGSSGSLIGKTVSFHFFYDPAAPVVPVPVGGVFDDQSGEWAYSLAPVVTVGGTPHDFIDTVPGTFAFATSATLGLIDDAHDGLTGDFHSLTYSGNVYSDYRSSSFAFDAILPSWFFSTDAVLPGVVASPHDGFAHSAATGTGSFAFYRQTCFFTCSYKAATATFGIDHVTFAAVPEPATWGLMVIGFGGIGAASRRRRSAIVVTG